MKTFTDYSALSLGNPRSRSCPLPATIVVGLGNEMLSDDGAGISIARQLRRHLDPRFYAVCELSVGGLELAERICGYRRAVVIDACRSGRRPVGMLSRHAPDEFLTSLRTASYHTVDFPSAIEFVRLMGGRLPEDVTVFAFEVEDIETVREGYTPHVAARIESAAAEIARILESERMDRKLKAAPAG